MVDDLLSLSAQVAAMVETVEPGRRLVVAIAGPPAAGKTTVAQQLSESLAPQAAVLGIDAFHFDNDILDKRGDRDRKGAPHTFDVVAYLSWLELLRCNVDEDVSIPVFDRSLELTRNCARIVAADQRVLITEGNYLLFNASPWDSLRALFDLTVWIDTPLPVVETRIVQRWLDHGFSREQAERRAETNDLPNARLVIEGSSPADIVLSSEK